MARQSRRAFVQGSLVLAGLGLLTGCNATLRLPSLPARLHHIGCLVSGALASNLGNLEAFRHGMRELGYVEGKHFATEIRSAEGRPEPLHELATELVRAKVDLILTSGNDSVRTVQQVTNTVPIVFASASDPVENGLVDSLARPGGNATGLTQEAGDESAKRLELLKQAVPGLSRVVALWSQPAMRRLGQTEIAARELGLEILPLELQNPDDVASVLASATAWRADGLIAVGGGRLGAVSPQIVNFAAQHRLPAIYFQGTFTSAGGLMVFGPSASDNYRLAASFVDKILKGVSPADLPVQRPTMFDFVVNLKAAHAIGLTIPLSVLQQATEIIQ